MPGIVGVVSSETGASVGTCIDNMIRPLLRRPWYKVERKISRDAGIASIAVNDERFIAEESGTFLSVTGEICDQEKLSAQLLDIGGEKSLPHYGLSDTLLRLYLRVGVEALCGLNGLYVICIWEGGAKKLTIVTDRYGFRKLYYWSSRKRLLFASEYKAIVWHPEFNNKIDELALADLLSVGYELDDRTLFEHVKLVPPASVMTYRNGGLSIRRYWNYRFDRKDGVALSEEQCIDEYFFGLREAVRKRAKDNLCLQVTGGLDSRCLAGILNQCGEGLKVKTVTIGHAHCHDVRYGRAIARSSGYEHVFLEVVPAYLKMYAKDFVSRLEGTINCDTSWIFAMDAFLVENRMRYVMNGFLGDCISGAHLPAHLASETSAEKAVRVLYDSFYNRGFRDEELGRLLRPNIYRTIRGECFNSVKRSFEMANTDNILNKADYVDLYQRQRRFIAAHIDVAAEFTRVLDPFADNDLVDFVLRLPVEMRVGQAVYRKMIVKHLPNVAGVPHSATGMPLDRESVRGMLWVISRRVRKGFHRATHWGIMPKWVTPHDYRSCFHVDEWLRTDSRDFMARVLSYGEYLEDFMDMDTVKNLITDHIEGGKNNSKKICAVATFALWRNLY